MTGASIPRLLRGIDARLARIETAVAFGAARRRGGRPAKVPADDPRWLDARRMYEKEGWGATHIARALKLHDVQVLRRARAEGWTRPDGAARRVPARRDPEWIVTARRLYEVDGLTFAAIGKRLGRSAQRIGQVAQRDGWRRPKRSKTAAAAAISPHPRAAAAPAGASRPPKRTSRPERDKDGSGATSRHLESCGRGANLRGQGNAPAIAQSSHPGDADAPAEASVLSPRRASAGSHKRRDPSAIPAAVAGSPSAAKRQYRKAAKAERDARYRARWEAGASFATLRAEFGLVSDNAVLIKAVRLGLPARAGDTIPAPAGRGPKATSTGIRMALEAKRAAVERLAAAAAAPDTIAAAKRFLQQKGVVIYAATVSERGADPDLLKVDGRPMLPQQMVDHAIAKGFVAAAAAPLLRRPGAAILREAPGQAATQAQSPPEAATP